MLLFYLCLNTQKICFQMCLMFIINVDTCIHNYSTRQTRKLHVPIGKSSMVYKTVKYRGTYLSKLQKLLKYLLIFLAYLNVKYHK